MAESKVEALVGNELADDYTRTVVPQGRWGDTWDVFKSNFTKLVLINVLTLVFFVPTIIVMILRSAYLVSLEGIAPGDLVAFPAQPDLTGLSEQLVFSTDLIFFAGLIVCGLFAAIGLAGALYSIKRLLNTHGDFTVKGYFHGVKVGYLNTVLTLTLFLVFLYATVLMNDWANLQIALGASAAGPRAAAIIMIILTVLVGIVCMWLLAVGISYKLSAWQLVKNSFVLLIGNSIVSLFFIALALLPVSFLFMGNFMRIVAYVLFIFIGFSYIGIVWMSYTQGVFDTYITPNLKAAKEDADSRKTPEQLAQEKLEEQKAVAMQLLAAGKSELIGKPIAPVKDGSFAPLPRAFTREDLRAIEARRATLNNEITAYTAEHEKDAKYVAYNKLFAEREKALKVEKKKGKKGKVSSDNLLH
jgi:hypothetical protein